MNKNYCFTLAYNLVSETEKAVHLLYEQNDKSDFEHIIIDLGFPLEVPDIIPVDIYKSKENNTKALKELSYKYGSTYIKMDNEGVTKNWTKMYQHFKPDDSDMLIAVDPDERPLHKGWVKRMGEICRADKTISMCSLTITVQADKMNEFLCEKKTIAEGDVYVMNGFLNWALIGISGRFLNKTSGLYPAKGYPIYGFMESELYSNMVKYEMPWCMLPDHQVEHTYSSQLLCDWKSHIVWRVKELGQMSFDDSYFKKIQQSIIMTEPEISLVRPFDFSDSEYHLNKWKEKNITILICQRNTNDLIQLCLESLLRFYPDIPILIVDGSSTDDSIFYCKYKELIHPNIKIWIRNGRNSHGITMDEALKQHIKTRYVLLCDSDIIMERGGLIQDMLSEFYKNELLYAIGSIMLVTRSNYGCGAPKDESDILRYAHPSFSIYDVEKYHQLNAPFVDHGAPCVYNMIEAEKKGFHISYYPVDKYISHLSGGSWTEPRTIWANDHNVYIRPFVTFILSNGNHIEKIHLQTDHDFDIITIGNAEDKFIVVHGFLPLQVNNSLFGIRHNITGEYVCLIPDEIETIQPEFVHIIKHNAIEKKMPDEMNVGGLNCIRRTLWQKRESLK